MDEKFPLDFSALLAAARQLLRDGIAPPRDKAVKCEWSISPTTGRLESHWVTKTEAPQADVVINGVV